MGHGLSELYDQGITQDEVALIEILDDNHI